MCCAGSRIFVQEGIYDEFVEKIKDRFNKLKIGDPLNPKKKVEKYSLGENDIQKMVVIKVPLSNQHL